MTGDRVVLASLSAAMDGGFTAIADTSAAMATSGTTDQHRLIGGVAVMLHVERLGLDLPLRATGDADFGVPPHVLRRPDLVDAIHASGYQKVAGNRWERRIDDRRVAAVDLLIPTYRREASTPPGTSASRTNRQRRSGRPGSERCRSTAGPGSGRPWVHAARSRTLAGDEHDRVGTRTLDAGHEVVATHGNATLHIAQPAGHADRLARTEHNRAITRHLQRDAVVEQPGPHRELQSSETLAIDLGTLWTW